MITTAVWATKIIITENNNSTEKSLSSLVVEYLIVAQVTLDRFQAQAIFNTFIFIFFFRLGVSVLFLVPLYGRSVATRQKGSLKLYYDTHIIIHSLLLIIFSHDCNLNKFITSSNHYTKTDKKYHRCFKFFNNYV